MDRCIAEARQGERVSAERSEQVNRRERSEQLHPQRAERAIEH
jgi:hypothetical protein